MKREDIEIAATDYADNIPQDGHNKMYSVDGFKTGAKWRINSVWHDTSEIPEKSSTILLLAQTDNGKLRIELAHYNKKLDWNSWIQDFGSIIHWAYAEDLLPNKG